jgi:hypothetical protein
VTETPKYQIAFYADKEDLVDGHPPAQIAYVALKEHGGIAYQRVREAITRLIAQPPYTEDNEDPDLIGGPGSRWVRRHLYRLCDDANVPPEITAFTIWINTPDGRWWLTWSRDPARADRLLIHSLALAPLTQDG